MRVIYTEELIPKDNFKLVEGIIYYKDIPLWNCSSSSLDEYTFSIYHERNKGRTLFTLQCEDNFGDLYHYGVWNSKQEVLKWLENPYSIG